MALGVRTGCSASPALCWAHSLEQPLGCLCPAPRSSEGFTQNLNPSERSDCLFFPRPLHTSPGPSGASAHLPNAHSGWRVGANTARGGAHVRPAVPCSGGRGGGLGCPCPLLSARLTCDCTLAELLVAAPVCKRVRLSLLCEVIFEDVVVSFPFCSPKRRAVESSRPYRVSSTERQRRGRGHDPGLVRSWQEEACAWPPRARLSLTGSCRAQRSGVTHLTSFSLVPSCRSGSPGNV